MNININIIFIFKNKDKINNKEQFLFVTKNRSMTNITTKYIN
jgi:hypothetical protein